MSTLSVTTLQGLSSSPTPTTIEVASGHTLHAPGHVIQTVSQAITTESNVQSTNYTATGLTKAITPKFSTSKILALVNLSADFYQNGTLSRTFYFELTRASSQVAFKSNQIYSGVAGNSHYAINVHGTLVFEDSPSTTSTVTYAVNAKISSTSNGTTFRVGYNNSHSTLTLMEIAQ
tara:strand:- start:113 stop:640 length:528 start_codon:yes stop_codon:yes gene_type:complete